MNANRAIAFVLTDPSRLCKVSNIPVGAMELLYTPFQAWVGAAASAAGCAVYDATAVSTIETSLSADTKGTVLLLDAAYPLVSAQSLIAILDASDGEGRLTSLLAKGDKPVSVGYRVGAATLRRILREARGETIHALLSLLSARASHHILLQQDNAGLTADDPRSMLSLQDAARNYIIDRHMNNGVFFTDLCGVSIGPLVTIGAGTTIHKGTVLKGRTQLGSGCSIGPDSILCDAKIGNRVTADAVRIYDSSVESDTTIGPFAHIRPHCQIGRNVRIGNFVEIKNSVIGEGTKVSHLTYVGDTDCGAHVNFGCGTVTSNYDGQKKFRTTIGDHAFIGCNTNLVAPVTVGDFAYTAAGSTITEDVSENSLAIARTRQVEKTDWVLHRRNAQADTEGKKD